MTQITIKRVYDRYDVNDGLRVFVDRLWPRGIKKESLKYDVWAKDIAPSSELRKWYHSDPEENWSNFETLYLKELSKSQAVKDFIEQIQKETKVTLLYASKDKEQNHAEVLKEFLTQKLENG